MMPPPCTRCVEWFGYDFVGRCRKRPGHPGNHFDGLWWFDDNGLRVDGADHEYHPTETRGPAERARELVNA